MSSDVECVLFQSVDWNSDCSLLLSASQDHTLRIWAINTGNFLCVCVCVCVCVCSLFDLFVHLHYLFMNSCTGKQVQVLKGHQGAVRSCKFSRDNAVIFSGGYDRRAIAWVRSAAGILCVCARAYTIHAHTHTHTYIQAYIHIHTYIYSHTYTFIHAHIYDIVYTYMS